VNSRKLTAGAPKLRKTITPGTILIILSGRFRGRRVVFLKQLDSGLLLITGPFRVNGVPLRRVNQRYVVATSTKLEVTGVDCSKFNDAYFAKPKEQKKPKESESVFMSQAAETKAKQDPHRRPDQDAVDAKLISALGKDALVKQYLKTRFTLAGHMFPHLLKF